MNCDSLRLGFTTTEYIQSKSLNYKRTAVIKCDVCQRSNLFVI